MKKSIEYDGDDVSITLPGQHPNSIMCPVVPEGVEQWSTKEMAIAHNYDKNLDKANEVHDEFALFLKKNGVKNPAILDIGCCNGRVLNSFWNGRLYDYSKYHGVDCNAYTIDIAKKHWKNKENVSFDVFNLGKDDLDDLCLEQYDVVYLDSTLTWIKDWRNILAHLVEKVPIVYCNRTIWITTIVLDCETSRLERLGPDVDFNFYSSWGGSKEPQLRIFLNEEYLDVIADHFDRKLIKYREDDYDGNWFDFYSYVCEDICPLVQQEVRENNKIGDIVHSQFLKHLNNYIKTKNQLLF